MRAIAGVMLICLVAGCRPPRPGVAAGAVPAADSIVLERTNCYGACPAYRLSVSRSGRVHFVSRNWGDSTRAVSTTPSRGAFAGLMRQAQEIGFWTLPDTVVGSVLCQYEVTDHPFVTVTIFGRRDFKRVADYLGCFDGPPELRRFEMKIDSAAGSARWVRPATFAASPGPGRGTDG